jgi:hypothetical protein
MNTIVHASSRSPIFRHGCSWGVNGMGRRRDSGSRTSEAGRTAAVLLMYSWQRLEKEPACRGRVLVHLDGAVTCTGACEDARKVYHAVRPMPCRGKRGPASETCARCTGRPELDLSSLVSTTTSLMRVSEGLRQMLAAAPPPEKVGSDLHHAARVASAELSATNHSRPRVDTDLGELEQ